MDSYHYSKKRLLRQFRHHISYVYRTYKCGYLRCIKNRNFGIILFFYNVVPWSIPREWCLCSLHHCLRLFWYWSHRLTHVNRFGGQLTSQFRKKYNLSVAFRLGWTQHIKIIFFIPVALMGFDPPLFLYVIKLRFSINFGFIPNILERPQLNIFCHSISSSSSSFKQW
jgi:hypothetical protein